MTGDELGTAHRASGRATHRYDAFVSYSHRAGRSLAVSLQHWLQQIANPWYKLRAMRVFRDQTDLAASPHLWQTIAEALDASRYFILLASPDAAQSPWVKREVRRWIAPHLPDVEDADRLDDPIAEVDALRVERLLIVLTDGNLAWKNRNPSEGRGDFDWDQTDSLPKALAGVFAGEPLWVDLRSAAVESSAGRRVNRSDLTFIEAICRLAAAIRGIDANRLLSLDYRLLRQRITTAVAAMASIVVLGLALAVAGYAVQLTANAAAQQEQLANAGQLAAEALVAIAQPARIEDAAKLALAAHLLYQAVPSNDVAPSWLVHLLQRVVGFVAGDVTEGAGPLARLSRSLRMASEANDGSALSGAAAAPVLRRAYGFLPEPTVRVARTDAGPVTLTGFVEGEDLIYSVQMGNDIHYWDAASGSPRETVFLRNVATAVNGRKLSALSGNGRWAATSNAMGDVAVRSLPDGTSRLAIDSRFFMAPVASVREPRDPESVPVAVTEVFAQVGGGDTLLGGLALNFDGTVLVMLAASGRARAFSLEGGSAELADRSAVPLGEVFETRVQRVLAVALDAAGERLAASSSSIPMGRGEVRVWNVKTGEQVVPPLVHSDTVRSIAFSRDGTLIATGSSDGTARVWDAVEGRPLWIFRPAGRVEAVAVVRTSDQTLLAAATSGDDRVTQVWDVHTGFELIRIPHRGNVRALAFDRDGNRLLTEERGGAAGPSSNQATVWRLSAASNVVQARMRHENSRVSTLEFSADGGRIASAGSFDRISVWDTEDGRIVAQLPNRSGRTEAIAFHASGGQVTAVSFAEDELAVRWDLASHQSTPISGPGHSRVSVVGVPRFMPEATLGDNGEMLARLVRDQDAKTTTVEVWDLAGPELTWQTTLAETVSGLALAPDGTSVAFSSGPEGESGLVHIVIFGAAEPRTMSIPVDRRKNHLAFSADGARVAAAGGVGTVYVIDRASGRIVLERQPLNQVDGIGLGPEGHVVAEVGSELVVRVVDVSTGTVLALLPFDSDTRGGTLRFHPDGDLLYLATNNTNANLPTIWRYVWRIEDVAAGLQRRLALVP